MIFRKPYAMLIKYFKFIHAILTICMAYLIYRTYNLNNFLSEYMKTTMLELGKGSTSSMFNFNMYLIPIILVIFSSIMLVIMIRKQKPKTLYLLNIINFIITLILYAYLNNQFMVLEQNILSAKSIRLMYDFTVLMLIMQIILIIPTLIRAIGFDIKKFDFKRDLMNMNIDATDNEEFEVSFELEGNVIQRTIKRKLRYLKYNYIENKFLFRILFLFITLIIIFVIFKNSTKNNTIMNMNEGFYGDGINIALTDAFITNNNYKLKQITKQKYVILELNTKAVSANTKLNTARMQLIVNKKIYYPKDNLIIDDFSDLGTLYIKNNLNIKDYKKYLIVFEIPQNLSYKEMSFRYITNLDKTNSQYVTIHFNAKNIDKKVIKKDMELNKEIILNKDTLNEIKFEIENFDLQNEFISNYQYCVKKDECYSSKEYIRPNLNTTIDKALLKIDTNYIKDEKKQLPGINNAFNIIDKFGTLVYRYNGTTYKINGKFTNINPKKLESIKTYYIEVNKKMLESDYVYLLLRIRNKEYKYIIKNIQK